MSLDISEAQVANWVLTHFPDAKMRKSNTEFVICNPFDGDTGYHFNISIRGCHDWRGDNWVGYNPNTGARNKCTFVRFVQLYLECSYTEALKSIMGSSFSLSAIRASYSHQKLEEREERKKDTSLGLPSTSRPISNSKETIVKGLRKWLHRRGVDDRKIAKYNMLYSSFDIIWPYYEYEELVYWQSRSRLNKEFAFPPESIGVTKGQFIFGFDHVEPSSYIVITEAIFDAQTLEDQAVASGGAALTSQQVRKVKALNPRDGIILAPDNDKAGLESVIKNYEIFRPYGFQILVSIPPSIEYEEDGEKMTTKDWNEVGSIEGFDKVKKIMQDNVEKLSAHQRMKIRSDIENIGKIY